MQKITFQTDYNQNSFTFSVDYNDIFDHKYCIDPGNLFSILYRTEQNRSFIRLKNIQLIVTKQKYIYVKVWYIWNVLRVKNIFK